MSAEILASTSMVLSQWKTWARTEFTTGTTPLKQGELLMISLLVDISREQMSDCVISQLIEIPTKQELARLSDLEVSMTLKIL